MIHNQGNRMLRALFSMSSRTPTCLLAGLLLFGPPLASGASVVLNSDTSITSTDTSYEGADLVIDNCVVTMDGQHSFRSLSITGGGRLTHPPCDATTTYSLELILTQGLLVDETSAIDVSGKGYAPGRMVGNVPTPSGNGNTGGSYGGLGGRGLYGGTPVPVYGNYRDPKDLGSGGGGGGAGGGLVRVTAATAQIDGKISANGTGSGWNTSGGSGGGIYLKCGTLSGSGSISATGGVGEVDGGSGSGGRIAIYHTALSGFDLAKVSFLGGNAGSGQVGGSGSFYSRRGNEEGTLLVMGRPDGRATASTPLGIASDSRFTAEKMVLSGTNLVVHPEHQIPVAVSSLILTNGAVLTSLPTVAEMEYSLQLTITNDLAIDPGSKLDVTGKGYPANRTQGNSPNANASGNTGGSYGGLGGIGYYGGNPNLVYGDYRNPNELGTGPLSGNAQGGGLIRVTATRALIDGAIQANGSGWEWNTAGGSGGAIRMDVGSLSGSGIITADGGNGNVDGGSGSGGRIAIYYATLGGFNLAGITSFGGISGSGQPGGSGSVYLKRTGNQGELRLVDRGTGRAAAWTPLGLPGQDSFETEQLVISGTNLVAAPEHAMPLYADSISLLDGAVLTTWPTTTEQEYRLLITLTNTLTIDSASSIQVNGRGYTGGRTVDNTTNEVSTGNTGGSYGGLGGIGYYGGKVNPVYGDYRDPNELGTGATTGGARGGGLVRITGKSALVNGSVQANGAGAGWNTAGGSGGGIHMRFSSLSGNGAITADGGPGNVDGGGGSGGRVALYYDSLSGLDLASITSFGGTASSGQWGASGSVYLKQISQEGVLRLVDRPGAPRWNAWSILGTAQNAEFSAQQLVLSGTNLTVATEHQMPITVSSLSLLQGATLTTWPTTLTQEFKLFLTVTNTFLVDNSSKVNLTGCGYLAGRTEDNASGTSGNGGGSYGGLGGAGYYDGKPNPVYGDYRDPSDLGSGSGREGVGGGLARISAKNMVLDGVLQANGTGGGWNTAGGSGGGIRLDVGTLSGTGTMTASGGPGIVDAGSGGGGRIAVYYNTLNGFNLRNIFTLGGTVSSGSSGGAGTIYLKQAGKEAELHLTDAGQGNKTGITLLGTPADNEFRAEAVFISGKNVTVLSDHSIPIRVSRLHLSDGVTLTHHATTDTREYALDIVVTNDFVLDASSKLDANGRGYVPGKTVGNTSVGAPEGNVGGSYGGLGGTGYYGGRSNRPYGDYRTPRELGTGSPSGGSGGGSIRLVAGSTTLDGLITANGAGGGWNSGGGSGGSIWVATTSLGGEGAITANGGPGNVDGGSGSGGRIALYYGANQGFVLEKVLATGGSVSSGSSGGPGSVYLKQNGKEGILRLWDGDAGSKRGIAILGTPQDAVFHAENLVIAGTNVTVMPEHPMQIRVGTFSLLTNAWLTHPAATADQEFRLDLLATNEFYVDAISIIDVSGRGYLPGRTVGNTTVAASTPNAGGSHGGLGGSGYYGGTPNALYGDERNPRDLGSGGSTGGSGGGSIRISANHSRIDGQIFANGTPGGWNTAGGSGGSILMDVRTLAGSGAIKASGGPGSVDGGGGGGGRIALYCTSSNTFDLSQILTDGGTASSGKPGQTGSVLIATSPTFFWEEPIRGIVHGVSLLRWASYGFGAAEGFASIQAYQDGSAFIVAERRSNTGSLDWDTTSMPDGDYELKVVFQDGDLQYLGEAVRQVTINNSAIWHSGIISQAESWDPNALHVVEDSLVIASNGVVTLPPGGIVKVTPGAQIRIQTGGQLVASGTSAQPVVFTSIADDTLGGDTNLDGQRSKPQPGEWKGISVESAEGLVSNEFTDLRYARLDHSGTLTANETWKGSFLHRIKGELVVANNVTLTIEPGAVLKLDLAASISLQPKSQLIAKGTVAEPILFTSIRDDSASGDTNGDGTDSAPSAGDWRWVVFDSAEGEIDHCTFRFGGGPAEGGWGPSGGPGKATIKTQGASIVKVLNSIIADSFYDGILAWGGPVTVQNTILTGIDRAVCAHPGSPVEVINCTLHDNRIALLIHGGSMNAANTLVTESIESGFQFDFGTIGNIQNCNVWSTNGTAVSYRSMQDLTGTSGNISTNPKYRDVERGNFRLGYGSPCIDAGKGALASATDLMGAPRYNDPRTPDRGTAAANGAVPDIGAYEFVETADSDLDLAADWVRGPADVEAGTLVTVRWQIRNSGTARAAGPWHDRVSLVADSPTRGVTRLEITNVLTEANLSPGETTINEVTLRVPGGTEGVWRWEVVANSEGEVFEGRHWENNGSPLSPPVSLRVPSLTIGTALSDGFAGPQQASWYQVTQKTSEDLLVTLNAAASKGRTRIYAGFDSMPTETDFDLRSQDWNSVDASLGIPSGLARTIYLLLVPESLQNGVLGFELKVSSSPFGVAALGLAAAGNAGHVTVPLVGSGFGSSLAIQLRPATGGTSYNALKVTTQNSANALATFDLRGAAPGVYHVAASQQGLSSTLSSAFTIRIGSGGRFNTALVLPAQVRVGRPFQGMLEFSNEGDADLIVPLVTLQSTAGNPIWSGSKSAETSDTVLQLLAMSPESPSLVLRPGERHSIPFFSKLKNGGTDNYYVTWFGGEDATALDWNLVRNSLRPASADAFWEQSFTELQTSIGPTVGDYVQALGQASVDFAGTLPAGARPYHLLWALLDRQKAQAAGASIAGRVLDRDLNSPIAGAQVVARNESTGRIHLTETAAEGSFAFRNLEAVAHEVWVEGYQPNPAVTVAVPVAQPLELAVSLGGAIVGRAVTAEGQQPVAGAQVQAQDLANGQSYSAETDPEGYYRILGLADSSYQVSLEAEGYIAPEMQVAEVLAGHETTTSFSLVTGGGVAGKILSRTGVPVSGATVRAFSLSGSPGRTTTSGASGEYTLAGLAPGAYEILASAVSHGAAAVPNVAVIAGEIRPGVDLTLTSPATLAGKVLDATTAQPIWGASVALDERSADYASAVTDASGLYTLTGAAPGARKVWVWAEGYQEQILSVTLNPGAQTSLNVSLQPLASISGTVRQAGGNSLVNAPVMLTSTNGVILMSTTDAQGKFAFGNLPDGTYTLAVEPANGLEQGRKTVVLSQAIRRAVASFDLPGTALHGVVQLPASSAGAANVRVDLARAGETIASTRTDAEGRYSFLVFDGQAVDLFASGNDIGFASTKGVPIPTSGLVHAPVLSGGALQVALQLRSQSADGPPVADATVILRPTSDSAPSTSWLAGKTDASGTVRFTNLPPGDYLASGSAPGLAQIQQVLTAASNPTPTKVALSTGRVVRGTIRDPQGSPVSAAWVTVTAPDSADPVFGTITEEDGSFAMDNLPAGSFSLWAGSTGLPLATRDDIDLLATSTASVELSFQAEGGMIGGYVRDAAGQFVPNARVQLTTPAGTSLVEARTDSSGYYELGPLGPETYVLKGTAGGVQAISSTITLASEDQVQDYQLGSGTAMAAVFGGVPGSMASLHQSPSADPESSGITLHSGDDTISDWWTLVPRPKRTRLNVIAMDPENYWDSDSWRVEFNSYPVVNPNCPAYRQAYQNAQSTRKIVKNAFDAWVDHYEALKNVNKEIALSPAQISMAALKAYLFMQTLGASAELKLASSSLGLAQETAVAIYRSINERDYKKMEYFQRQMIKQMAAAYKELGGTPLIGQANSVWRIFWDAKEGVDHLLDAYKDYQNITVAKYEDLKYKYWRATDAHFSAMLKVKAAGTQDCPCEKECCDKPKPCPPPPPKGKPGANSPTSGLGSFDPNDKLTIGYGKENYITEGTRLVYTIRFENKSTATAPAQQVLVTDVLEQDLDWSTLELISVGFNNVDLPIPPGLNQYLTHAVVATDPNNEVEVAAALNPDTGVVQWTMTSIDPITGDLPEDPLAGFLPPNDAQHRGEGYVSYSILPRAGLVSGTVITNGARIVFDTNPYIDAPTVTNRIDSVAPTSAVKALPAQSGTEINVAWEGNDPVGGSGLAGYDLYVSANNGAYLLAWSGATNTSTILKGETGVTYRLFTVARDHAGNVEPAPTTPDAVTTVAASSGLAITGIQAVRLADPNHANHQVILTWPSVAGKTYNLWWSTNLPQFQRVVTGIPATPPHNTYTNILSGSESGFLKIEISP